MHIVLSLEAPPDVIVEVSPLFPRPDDPSGWLRRVLLQGATSQEAVRAEAAIDLQTTLGWPYALFEVEVNGEPRLLALYHFLEWTGAVLVRGALGEAARARVLDGLAGARPDFSADEAVCLADLLPGGAP